MAWVEETMGHRHSKTSVDSKQKSGAVWHKMQRPSTPFTQKALERSAQKVINSYWATVFFGGVPLPFTVLSI